MLRFNSSLLIYLWAGHESCFCRSWWWQFNHCSNGPNKPSILSYLTTRGSFVLLRTSPTNTNNERHHIQQSAGYFHSEESETKRWQKTTRMYRSFKWPESNQWTCLIWLHQPNLLAKNFIEKKWTSAFHLLAKAPNFDSTKTKPASTTREVLIELTSSINR